MATHARGSGDPMSAAKLTLYGTIATAIIGAVTTILVTVLPKNDGPANGHDGAALTTTIKPANRESNRVAFNNLKMDGTGGVTVSGFTENDVDATGVVVSIGPKALGGYWYGFGNLSNGQWQADVRTDPPWQNYEISAAYYYGILGGASPVPAVPAPPEPKVTTEPAVPAAAPSGRLVSGTTSQSALMFAFQPSPTTSPPLPPDELMHCVEQFGPSCFNRPEFGPPSVYQPNQ